MVLSDPLVSVGLPIRNGERTLEKVVRSVLAQDHECMELVICDNASTDHTEELCRDLAATDSRIVYYRQPLNVGLLNNFMQAIRLAKGTFFRWVGDDDWLAPTYVSRCLEAFAGDSRLVLVTTQMKYTGPDDASYTHAYHGSALRSDDPIKRLVEFSTLLVNGMVVDPLYALVRRERVAAISRRNSICEDQIFATKLLMTGPWGHVPEILAHRSVGKHPLPALARRLGVPVWQAYFDTSVQCVEMLRVIHDAKLTPSQRRRARIAVAMTYLGRSYRNLTHRRTCGFMRLLTPVAGGYESEQ
jgi:glycosyltransferase involved in cell wall biosynthesis